MANNCHVCYVFCSNVCDNCFRYFCDKHAYHDHPIPWMTDGIEVPAFLCKECNDELLEPIFKRPEDREQEDDGTRKYLHDMYDDISLY